MACWHVERAQVRELGRGPAGRCDVVDQRRDALRHRLLKARVQLAQHGSRADTVAVVKVVIVQELVAEPGTVYHEDTRTTTASASAVAESR